MTEIPAWWLVVSAFYFIFGTAAMIAMIIVLVKVVQILKEITPQIKATAERVEQVATRVEEVSETVRATVEEMGRRARGIAGPAEGLVKNASKVVAAQSPWIVGVVTAIRIWRAIQEYRIKGQPKTNGEANPSTVKSLPKPTAKAKP
jgi:hypothetical protein